MAPAATRGGRVARALDGVRIVLVEQFFYPEGWGGAEITRDLAVHYVQQGARVEVICGSEQYARVDGGAGPDPDAAGVTICRIPPFPDRRDVHTLKILRHAWFGLWALLRLLFVRPPDLFVAQTNPPPVVLLVGALAWFWRKPFLLIAMDLYPEVLFANRAPARRSLADRLALAVFGRAYRSATRVVALGPVMAERIVAKGVPPARITEIGNWGTGPPVVVRGWDNPLRSEWDLGADFVLVYSGNLGVGHEFETLLQGVAAARERVRALRLVFIGGGARLAEVRKRVRQLGLGPVVIFEPWVPARRLPVTLGLADLGVVTLRDGFEGLMVPSKLAGYLARGIPALYIGPRSEVDALVSRYACGFSLRNGDAAGVVAAIVAAAGDRARLARLGRAARCAYARELARVPGLARHVDAARACLAAGRRGRST